MATAATNEEPTVPVELSDLRGTLIRLEETIIFSLIERAQFAHNKDVYDPSKTESMFGIKGYSGSFADYFLHETEKLHATVRRYTDPCEHPFFRDLPSPISNYAPLGNDETRVLPSSHAAINCNDKLRAIFVDSILPNLTRSPSLNTEINLNTENPESTENSERTRETDGHFGSSVTCDVAVLQALSMRVHYGKLVAEAKFIKAREVYRALAERGDFAGILDELTNTAVEEKLLERVRRKAETYGSDVVAGAPSSFGKGEADASGRNREYKIDPSLVVDLYQKWIIPLTKEVEVRYLLLRCGQDPWDERYKGVAL